jgi:hypothetical protein
MRHYQRTGLWLAGALAVALGARQARADEGRSPPSGGDAEAQQDTRAEQGDATNERDEVRGERDEAAGAKPYVLGPIGGAGPGWACSMCAGAPGAGFGAGLGGAPYKLGPLEGGVCGGARAPGAGFGAGLGGAPGAEVAPYKLGPLKGNSGAAGF